MGRYGIAAAVAAFLFAAAALARAQEPTVQERLRKSNVEAANAIRWEEGDVEIVFLTGGVTMKRPDMSLQAGRAMLWRNKDSKDQLYDEIYAKATSSSPGARRSSPASASSTATSPRAERSWTCA